MKKLLSTLFTFALLTAVPAAFAQQPVAQQRSEPAPAPALTEYAGTYKFSDNGYFTKLTLTVENGKLYGQVDENEKYEYVRQTNPDAFKSTSSYGSLFTFTRDTASRQVTGFTMQIQGNEISGKKEK